MRKQIGIKFDEDFIEFLNEETKRRKYKDRTELIETVLKTNLHYNKI